MKWYASYIGLPYKPHGRDENGVDCWGLVRLVYQERFNIELNDLADGYSFDKRRLMLESISGTFEAEARKWKKIDIQDCIPASAGMTGSHAGCMQEGARRAQRLNCGAPVTEDWLSQPSIKGVIRNEGRTPEWCEIAIKDYDVAAFTLHGFVYHVGIVVSATHMIHVEGKEGVVLQPFNRKDLYGFYRYC